MSLFLTSHVLRAITIRLKQLVGFLEDIQKRTHLQNVIRFENEALALLDESGEMAVVRRFSKIDAHSRDLQKMVARKIYKHHQELDTELLEPVI